MDVKSTFLSGHLKDEVYMIKPLGFEMLNSKNKAKKLKKVLNNLNHTLRAWNKGVDNFLQMINVKQCWFDH